MNFKNEIDGLSGKDLISLKIDKEIELREIEQEIIRRVKEL